MTRSRRPAARMPLATHRSPLPQPPFRPLVLVPLLLLLLLLAPCIECSASLRSLNLLINVDRISALGFGDLLQAYQLVQPNVTISSRVKTSQPNIADVSANVVDFGIISSGLTAAQATLYPQLQLFPVMCSAIVPIYRIDALSGTLVLSRQALAGIYAGTITWWNDSRIQATNGGTLPLQRIRVVYQGDLSSVTTTVLTALGKFQSGFPIAPSSLPTWPLQSYAAYGSGTGVTGVSAAVLTVDGSIGYAPQSNALATGASVASLINWANQTIRATASSVTAAITEVASGYSAVKRQTLQLDYTDGHGAQSWPISLLNSLLIDMTNSRGTCHQRAAVVDFWTWYYTSAVPADLLSSRQYATIPAFLQAQLDPVTTLQTSVMCRGSPALTTVTATARKLSTSTGALLLSSLLSSAYLSVDASVNWQPEVNSDELVMDEVINAETDIGFFIPENVDPTRWQQVLDTDEFLILPTYLIALAWIYNPQISTALTIPTAQLNLDIRTITLIYFSCILYMNDSHIVSLNPAYAAQLHNSSVMITQNVGCGSTPAQTPVSYTVLERTLAYMADHPEDVELNSCVNNYPAVLYYDYYQCISVPSLGVYYAAAESTVPALVVGTPGAMGMMVVNGDSTLGVPTMVVERGGVKVNTMSDVASIAACAQGAFDATTLSFDTANPINVTCWPWTQQVVAMVRKNYVSSASATSAKSCSRGLNALQYLQWLYTSVQVDAVASLANVVRLSSLSPDIQAAYLDALNGVLCDGSTLLITLPNVWRVSSGLSAGAGSLCLLGALACLCCIAYTWVYRHHPVIRSSSPHFLSMSLLGVCVLLVGSAVLAQPPSLMTCSAMAWLWSFGFSLCFAPLFAKTWRIYRIFGRRKLSVVKISNRKLAVLVLVILTLDLVLLSIWQSLSPAQPYTTTAYTGSQPVTQNEYSQCGVDGDGRTMLAATAVSKGVLLLFGALMAFTTRKVTSTFNESSQIALAIYNVLFSIGIVAPIVLVIQAKGDVLVLLLLFLGLWVSAFTAAVLFVPKLLHIHGAQAAQINAAADASKASSSGQYSFLSMAQLSTLPIVMAYVAALKSHLNTAERRLADLKAKQSGAVGGKGASAAEPSTSHTSPPQHGHRATLTLNPYDSHTPTSHRRIRSIDTPTGPASDDADALSQHNQPAARQRSGLATQTSPLPREKRAVGPSRRAEGSVAGDGGAGGEVSGVRGASIMLGGKRTSSVSSVEDVSRSEEASEDDAGKPALIGAVEENK